MGHAQQGEIAYRRTIEQERAQQAWEAIEQVRGSGEENDYGTRARNLPSMIQVNGLGATLAFLRAKAGADVNDADYRLYEHLSQRIVTYLESDHTDVMDFIRDPDTDADTYRRATAEAIAFGIWLRRYVEAEGWKASN